MKNTYGFSGGIEAFVDDKLAQKKRYSLLNKTSPVHLLTSLQILVMYVKKLRSLKLILLNKCLLFG